MEKDGIGSTYRYNSLSLHLWKCLLVRLTYSIKHVSPHLWLFWTSSIFVYSSAAAIVARQSGTFQTNWYILPCLTKSLFCVFILSARENVRTAYYAYICIYMHIHAYICAYMCILVTAIATIVLATSQATTALSWHISGDVCWFPSLKKSWGWQEKMWL